MARIDSATKEIFVFTEQISILLNSISDSAGNMVLSAMISKMPEVAYEALDQLSAYNRRHRKQYYYINEVVPSPEEIQLESKDQVPTSLRLTNDKKLITKLFAVDTRFAQALSFSHI